MATTTPTRGTRRASSRLLSWGPPLVVAAILVAAAYIANAALGERSFLLPAPHDVLAKAVGA
ncbi:hypothetical protein [Demequina litorisediminis]|uniref:ABC transporter permease n=1 Tax=Demequina litorisediminis TaxID=1849022 RepID=A0ABQ6I8B0_9MICO|nr:hypothetical protein [Demequina litorisediminis]GMA34015.1 hypothetical protein GCM10025876_02190 [Demequina litorisediminis]